MWVEGLGYLILTKPQRRKCQLRSDKNENRKYYVNKQWLKLLMVINTMWVEDLGYVIIEV